MKILIRYLILVVGLGSANFTERAVADATAERRLEAERRLNAERQLDPNRRVTSDSERNSDSAANATAFALVREGNRHLGEEAKDRVVQIRSEKSIGSLTPTVWYIVYYDPDATAKAAEVKFAAGKKVAVKRPARILEFATGNTEIDRDRLKIDSDEALAIARKEPIFDNLKLTATEMKLERWSAEPVWKIRFWAEKLRDPSRTADIGQIYVHATTGEVVKRDTQINRVD